MSIHGCPKGPSGAMGVIGGDISRAIDWAVLHFGVQKDEVLLGYKKTPPDVNWCKVYIYYNGGGAEFWIKQNKKWVNWSYLER